MGSVPRGGLSAAITAELQTIAIGCSLRGGGETEITTSAKPLPEGPTSFSGGAFSF